MMASERLIRPRLVFALALLPLAVAVAGDRASHTRAAVEPTSAAALASHLYYVPESSVVAATWREVGPDGEIIDFYSISLDGGVTFSRPLMTSYDLGLRFAAFDPLLDGVPEVPAALAAGPDHDAYIVQFVTPPLAAYRNVLKSFGAEVFRRVAFTGQVVRMSPQARDAVAALEFVRWIGPYHPAYKIDPDLIESVLAGEAGGELQTYSIEALPRGPEAQASIGDQVIALGGDVINAAPGGFRMTVALAPAQLAAILRRSDVNFVDAWGPGGPDMDIARQLGGAVPVLSDAGFLGQGVRGEVFDTEVQKNHPEWAGQAPLLNGPDGGSSPHGTSCYGILFSTGVVQSKATGLLPQREQGIYNFFLNSTQHGGPTPRLEQNQKATDPNGPLKSCFQTSSVGSPWDKNYTTISAETDDYLMLVDYLSFQSQSNSGSQLSRPQAWAKNIVSVGGVVHNNTLTKSDDGVSGASTGPASDERIKPDLSHIYDEIYTTMATSTYTEFCCTSGATPITAGHGGLLMQMWHEGVWKGHGGKETVFLSRPRSTTAKALLINTAFRYPLTQNGLTRDRQGWGMVDVAKLYQQSDRTYVVDEQHRIAPFGVNAYLITVPAGTPEFAVTLAYIDPPGNPAVQSVHRVNDLSLRVTSPDGAVYWGNYGLKSSNLSSAGGSSNIKDTVENVFINDPAPGLWIVEVLGDDIIEDARLETPELDADYALVIRGKGPEPIGCPGDVDLDGVIGQSDLGVLLAAFDAQFGDPQYSVFADFDGDGAVDQSDLGELLAVYGSACP